MSCIDVCSVELFSVTDLRLDVNPTSLQPAAVVYTRQSTTMTDLTPKSPRRENRRTEKTFKSLLNEKINKINPAKITTTFQTEENTTVEVRHDFYLQVEVFASGSWWHFCEERWETRTG